MRRFAKSGGLPRFLERLRAWEEKQVARFTKAERPDKVDAVRDQVEVLVSLAEVATGIPDLEARLDALFTDDGLGQAGVVTCSSIHRAKGLEAERVFVLAGTLRNHNTEELKRGSDGDDAMTTKFFEIRDRATSMPVLAMDISATDHPLAVRAGFGPDRLVILIDLCKMTCQYDVYDWATRARTIPIAHNYITENWDRLQTGDVVDVEFLLGERPRAKDAEWKERR